MKQLLTVICLLTALSASSQNITHIEYNGRSGYFITQEVAFNMIDSALSFQSWKKFTAQLQSRSDSLEKKLAAYQKLDASNQILVSAMAAELETSKLLHKIDNSLISEYRENFKIANRKIAWLKLKSTGLEVVIVAGVAYIVYEAVKN